LLNGLVIGVALGLITCVLVGWRWDEGELAIVVALIPIVTARRGNILAALDMLIAVAATLWDRTSFRLLHPWSPRDSS
jgi:hypothetical protein